MAILTAVAMLLFVVTCSAVGLRLLALAVRRGDAAAWSCGLGFTLIALLGYPLTLASGNGRLDVGDVDLWLLGAGSAFTQAGLACFAVFTVQVFRAGERWAQLACGTLMTGLAIVTVGYVYAVAVAPAQASSFEASWGWGIALQASSLVCFGWIAVEGLRQWRLSLRRLALGLVDPVVSDRFLLWGVFGLSTVALVAVFAVVHLSGQSAAGSPLVHCSTALFGFTSSAAASLAFFPPRTYLARIRARAGAGA